MNANQREGKRILRDEEVMFARRNIDKFGYKELAEMFGVTHSTIYRAVKGLTYRHINWLVKPQL